MIPSGFLCYYYYLFFSFRIHSWLLSIPTIILFAAVAVAVWSKWAIISFLGFATYMRCTNLPIMVSWFIRLPRFTKLIARESDRSPRLGFALSSLSLLVNPIISHICVPCGSSLSRPNDWSGFNIAVLLPFPLSVGIAESSFPLESSAYWLSCYEMVLSLSVWWT